MPLGRPRRRWDSTLQRAYRPAFRWVQIGERGQLAVASSSGAWLGVGRGAWTGVSRARGWGGPWGASWVLPVAPQSLNMLSQLDAASASSPTLYEGGDIYEAARWCAHGGRPALGRTGCPVVLQDSRPSPTDRFGPRGRSS